MRALWLCLWVLVAGGLVVLPRAALATHPGANGHIAYTKVVDADQAIARRAIFIDGAQVTHPDPRGTNVVDEDFYPTFSPDGKHLAFLRHDGVTGDDVFYLANANGSNLERLATVADLDNFFGGPDGPRSKASHLVWRPDGQAVGFVRKFQPPSLRADMLAMIFIADGSFGIVSNDASQGGVPISGFDWRVGDGDNPGGYLLIPCDPAVPRTLFCVLPVFSHESVATAYAPSPDMLDSGTTTPSQWQPDPLGGLPRGMTVKTVIKQEGSSTVYLTSLFSAKPYDRSLPNSVTSDLKEITSQRETVSCAYVTNGTGGTIYWPKYAYGNPVPSPDGSYLVVSRTENEPQPSRQPNGDVSCTIAPRNELRVLRSDGSEMQLVDTDIDTTYGLSWQSNQGNVLVRVNDGHGHPLHGVKVELRDPIDHEKLLYPADTDPDSQPINTVGGDYLFQTVVPGKYRVRVSLTDVESKAFDVQYDYPPSGPGWAERFINVPEGDGTRIAFEFPFNAFDVQDANPADPVLWDKLDALAAIFYNLRTYVDWVHLNMTPDTGALVPVFAFATTDASGNSVDVTHYSFDNIFIAESDSNYSVRESGGQGPVDIEWHEFGHHLYHQFVGGACPGDIDHLGYPNPDTCNSMDEGFAAFLAAAVNDSPNYANIWDLATPTKAWKMRLGYNSQLGAIGLVGAEDLAVASMFYQITHASAASPEYTLAMITNGAHVPAVYQNDYHISVKDLWSVLASTSPPGTVKELHDNLAARAGANTLVYDLDLDGAPDVSSLDESFLIHGFFPIRSDENLTPTHQTYHYNVEGARSMSQPNALVGQTDHDQFRMNGYIYPAQPTRYREGALPSANLSVLMQDASGRGLEGGEIVMTVHYPGFDREIRQAGHAGDNRVHLELPLYFNYLPPVDQTTLLPPCDPDQDEYVSVTLTATVNGYSSKNTEGFDNCTYTQAVLAATGSVAMTYPMAFGDDGSPPTTTIQPTTSGNVVGQFTDTSWTVTLHCDDPVVNDFASGCFVTQYSVDGASYVPYGNPIVISAPGLHTLAVSSRDGAGNAETVQTVSLGVGTLLDDATPPVTTAFAVASVPPNGNVTTGFWTVTLSCTDPASQANEQVTGCSGSYFSVDGGEYQPYSGPVGIHDPGHHTFGYFSFDVQGNYESPKTLQLEISQIAQVIVPDVGGLAQAAASAAIAAAGLNIGTVTTQSSNSIPSGSVIGQTPAGGASVDAGSAVSLVVSSGPALVNVPNVAGLTQSAATTAITNAGLVIGTVTTQSSNSIPSGSVVSQTPAAGTNVALGAAVNLVVSSGPQSSGSSFDALKAATQAAKITPPLLKDALLLDIATAQALYKANRLPAALAAMLVYQDLVRAASGHTISKADATNLLSLSDAVEQEIRTKLPPH